jgi:signal transduction histidine kinase
VRENAPLEQERDLDGPESAEHAVAALVDALRPLDREKTELLCAAAHELRTPLTCIVGFLELLREGAAGPVAPDQERVLRTVARNAAELTALVDALEPGRAGRAPVLGPGPADARPRG